MLLCIRCLKWFTSLHSVSEAIIWKEIRAASVSSENCLGGGDDTGCQMVQCGTTYVTQNGGKDMPALQSSLVLHHLIEFSLWYTCIIVFLSDILMAHVAYNYVVIICLSAPSRDAELYCRCHLHFGLIPIASRQSGLKYTYSRMLRPE